METSVTNPRLTRKKTRKKKRKKTVAWEKKTNLRPEGKEFSLVMTMTIVLMKISRTVKTKPATMNNRQRVKARQRRKAENLLARKWKCLMSMT